MRQELGKLEICDKNEMWYYEVPPVPSSGYIDFLRHSARLLNQWLSVTKCWLKGLYYRGQLQISPKGKHKGSINVKEKKAGDVVKCSWKGTAVEKHIQ